MPISQPQWVAEPDNNNTDHTGLEAQEATKLKSGSGSFALGHDYDTYEPENNQAEGGDDSESEYASDDPVHEEAIPGVNVGIPVADIKIKSYKTEAHKYKYTNGKDYKF